MTVAILSFFSRISDSRFGGTYMTLLNTLSNLGHVWSSSVAIGMIDFLTFKECSLDSKNNCSTKDLQNVRRTVVHNIPNFHYTLFLKRMTNYLNKFLIYLVLQLFRSINLNIWYLGEFVLYCQNWKQNYA